MRHKPFRVRADGANWTKSERELACRAVEIADSVMLERLIAHCPSAAHILFDEPDACYRPSGDDGRPVRRVDQAAKGVLDAFTYLYDRGIARIATDRDGDQIIVLQRKDD